MKSILLLSLLFVLLLAGCNLFLPAGDPPEGNILDNPNGSSEKKYTVTEAVDYLITMFTVAALEKCPGEVVGIVDNNDKNAYMWANVILQQSSAITGNRQTASTSDWMLDSKIDGVRVTVTLLHNGSPVWSDSVSVTR